MLILATVVMRKLATNPRKLKDQIRVGDESKILQSIKLSPFYALLECENYRRKYQHLSVLAFLALSYFPDLNTCMQKTAIILSIYAHYDVVLVL